MTVTFLRHGPLQKPFDNYEELTFAQLCQLARQEIDPSVDVNVLDELLSKNTQLMRSLCEPLTIYHSPSKRTRQTANYFKKILKVNSSEQLSELNEIMFDPSQLITEKEFAKKGMPAIREGLFRALIEDSNKETLESILNRIQKLENILRTSSAENILVITHGFFLRLIDLYFSGKAKHEKDFSMNLLQTATNYSYANGFTFTVY
jgi:broad specificity phosphatase PhoE